MYAVFTSGVQDLHLAWTFRPCLCYSVMVLAMQSSHSPLKDLFIDEFIADSIASIMAVRKSL